MRMFRPTKLQFSEFGEIHNQKSIVSYYLNSNCKPKTVTAANSELSFLRLIYPHRLHKIDISSPSRRRIQYRERRPNPKTTANMINCNRCIGIIVAICASIAVDYAEAQGPRGTNKTLAPTGGVTRPPETAPPVMTEPPVGPPETEPPIGTPPPVPGTPPPITPFPTEAAVGTPPPVSTPPPVVMPTPPPVVMPTPPPVSIPVPTPTVRWISFCCDEWLVFVCWASER